MSTPNPGTVVWFDLYAGDPDAGMSFYGKLFGWTFMPLPGMDGASVIHAADGTALGSLLKRDADAPQNHAQSTAIYVQVESLDDSFALATRLGATMFVPPSPIPGTDNGFALVRDPQQNMLGLAAPASTIGRAA
jgi:hypothetical protein